MSTPPLPTAEAWAAMQAEADRELRYWTDHRTDFLAKYPDHFVAVVDGAVFAVDTSLMELLDVLKHYGVDPTVAWVRFIPVRRQHLAVVGRGACGCVLQP